MARSSTRKGSILARPDLGALAERRIAIEGIDPEIDGGRFPARAVVGWPFEVEADVFSDGHDVIRAALVTRADGAREESEVEMTHVINDRWTATTSFPDIGPWGYSIIAWRDLFANWHKDTGKKIAAGLDVTLEAEEGRELVQAALEARPRPSREDRKALKELLDQVTPAAPHQRIDLLMSDAALELMLRAGPRVNLTRYEKELAVFVDPVKAAFSAWYELMPRSWGPDGEHGTFKDVIGRLDYVRDLGFDVLYFPPIHPIGKTNRKGRNNTLTPAPDDPGSPYAIGSEEGGHREVHPALGTLKDFDRLVKEANRHGLEVAIDFAIQCSPDHPWIKEHPEWFDWRPDGTIKFAENPPKKYEDIVNVHFYRKAIPDLWYELRDIVLFWIDHGVKIFRVDNPHTKPFPFWEWMIAEVREKYPDTVFLAEAFTRPKLMKRLAKVGFNQSYSYFTWRNTKHELTEYLTELTTEECRHYMRPNFFVNTPDINPVFLQTSGRPGFRSRLVLAASLGGNYGVYNGYEINEATPVPGKEEYLDSEKYQLRDWDFDREGHIKDDIRLMNSIRHEHPAMADFTNLRFFTAHDDAVLYYGKFDEATHSYLLFHVLLDPFAPRNFAFEVPLWEFGLPDDGAIEVRDLLHGNSFTWEGKSHMLSLSPEQRPYAIWQLLPRGGAA
ncbi:alpha-1,4-glucan--maltose-1-phosphate maltosyltransferase [Roseitranquillus sediminis]|uniref:alpha-1,4-glucan--maltose-1-phosphate maltosyltransferase n=1 Tax=Roseitranquillus sediminis TaxID=2809051 RepID=UPI001D0C3619|nr:alpha-1,4-glucan--maltose-1-phosphate maltosyltransferase [Roseitranquillus sediminis]MBM9594887.1 alpha-1,4-glucan--maltose-1-phosphate maltosyltransferase [Roseitranquillus sediminis]